MTDVTAAPPHLADRPLPTTSVHPARPIFLVGSLRSGVSILFASLAQHAGVVPVMDSAWIADLAANLQHAYAKGVHRRATSHLDITGVELDEFYACFGEAVDRLIRGPAGAPLPSASDRGGSAASADVDGSALGQGTPIPPRWLDASPDTCFHIVGLSRLFPEAKFIHVVRDARSVVRTLTDESLRSTYRSQFLRFSEHDAYEHWRRCVSACVTAEQAFGSDTIRRIRRDDLVDSPAATLQACLGFLGLPFDPACLRPFR
jgi:hypothetical protein